MTDTKRHPSASEAVRCFAELGDNWSRRERAAGRLGALLSPLFDAADRIASVQLVEPADSTCGGERENAAIDAAIVDAFKAMPQRGALTSDHIWDAICASGGWIPLRPRMLTRVGALVESGVLTMTSDDHGLYSDVYMLAEQWKDGEGTCVNVAPDVDVSDWAVPPRPRADVEAECVSLRADVERLTRESARGWEASETWRRCYEDTGAREDAALQDVERLRNEVRLLNADRRDLTEQVERAKEERDDVRRERDHAIATRGDWKMLALRYERERDDFATERDAARQDAAELRIGLANLRSWADALESDRFNARANLDDATARGDALSAERDTLRDVVELLRAEVMDLTGRLDALTKVASDFRRAWETEQEGGFNRARLALFAALDDSKA